MAMYVNQTKDSPIVSLEFTPTIDGNFSFFRVKDKQSTAAVKEQLETLGQKIIAESEVNGQPMLVTRGKRTDYNLLDSLTEKGNNFKAPDATKKMDMWKMRGLASMIGQPLQIASGFMTKGKVDSATIGFGSLNMIANIANWTLGAEVSKDTNQLRFLKRKFNYEISKYLPDGATSLLPSSYDDRIHLRAGKEKPPSLPSRLGGWLRQHSVSFCEIGLRYAGSVMLIFPITKWGTGMEAFGQKLKPRPEGSPPMSIFKKVGGAMSAGAKAGFNSNDKYTGYVGMGYVAGKTLAFTSKVEDPYDPKPHTLMDTFREKVVFRLSSVIETVAAAVLAYDRLWRKEKVDGKVVLDEVGKAKFARTINYRQITKHLEPFFKKGNPAWLESLKKAETRDWVGGIGGLLFTGGLIIRIFAPFGKREVDTKELNAHIVDGLAQIPQEKLPYVIADFASYLTEHFKGQVEYGAVYKELSDGLYRHHDIALPGIEMPTTVQRMKAEGLKAQPAEPEKTHSKPIVAEAKDEHVNPHHDASHAPIEQDNGHVDSKAHAAKAFAHDHLKKATDNFKAANLSHVERAAANDTAERSLSA